MMGSKIFCSGPLLAIIFQHNPLYRVVSDGFATPSGAPENPSPQEEPKMCFFSLGTSLPGNFGISRGIATQRPRLRLEQAAALTGDYEFHGENQ